MSAIDSAGELRVEKLLLRIVPGLSEGWLGSSEEEMSRIEAVAGRPLPDFYRWFLSRMGVSMGPMAYPTVDFSARGILAAYDAGWIPRDARFLLIGYERDELTPLHYFYDLDAQTRHDALVVRMLTPADESHEQFETLREMLAWGELWSQRVEKAKVRYRGTLRLNQGSLTERVGAVLQRSGFAQPIATGEHCGLYERAGAVLISSGTPGETAMQHNFALGADRADEGAEVLRALEQEVSVEVGLPLEICGGCNG
jgi:hypothetical protein